MDAELFSDYCVDNFELIVIIKIVFLNNQKGSFDILLPSTIIQNITAVRQIQNPKF